MSFFIRIGVSNTVSIGKQTFDRRNNKKVLFSLSTLKQVKKDDTSSRKASNLLGDVIRELSAENKLLIN